MNAEDIWLEANGLTGGSEADPYNLGDYARGSVIGNSGLYKRNDESIGDFARRLARASMGEHGEWGTVGRGVTDMQNAGFVNDIAPVTIDGVQYHRVGENIADPLFRQKLIQNNPKASNITRFFDQYDPASVSRYDPEQGYLMQGDKYDELVRAIESTQPHGVMAEDGPVSAFSKTIGTAMGISSLAAAGLGYAAANPATFGQGFSDWAGGALSSAGAGGGPYQSLWSSLGQNAASQGGSFSDITRLFGSTGATKLPASYWNMVADAAGTASDASGASAGSIPDSVWGNLYQEALNGGFSGSLGDLKNVAGLAIAPYAGDAAYEASGLSDLASRNATTALNGTSGGSSILDFLRSSSNPFTIRDLISGGVGLGSAFLNANAARTASGQQVDAAHEANTLLAGIYDQGRKDLEPYRTAGNDALGRIKDLLTPGKQLDTAMLDPGYNFRQGQGETAVNRAAAARGRFDSPRTIKDLLRFNQDYATGEFSNVFNRNAGVANMGQAAAAGTVNAGQNFATQAAGNITGAGNASAAGTVGATNAFTGAASNFLNNYLSSNLLRDLVSNRNSTSGYVYG